MYPCHLALVLAQGRMAVSLSAAQHQEKHGELLKQAPYADAPSPFLLHKALTSRRPPIRITHAAVKTWFAKYKANPNQQSIQSATELNEKHGDIVKHLSIDYHTAYKLGAALRNRDPPIFASDGVVKQWLMKYGSKMTYIDNAGHLEDLYGQRIREEWPGTEPRGDLLHSWLQKELQVARDGGGPYVSTHTHIGIIHTHDTMQQTS